MGGIESRQNYRERRLSPLADIGSTTICAINHWSRAIKLFPLRLHLCLHSRALASRPIVIVEDFTKTTLKLPSEESARHG